MKSPGGNTDNGDSVKLVRNNDRFFITIISADIIAPYPPGIPVILPGEIITSDIINNVLEVKESGIKINGPRDKKLETIAVIK